MNNTSMLLRGCRLAAAVGLAGWLLGPSAQAAPNTGEAIVVARTGQASARVFTGPVHEGRTESRDLVEGTSVGETSDILTGKDGRLCMACSPGAIICVAPETELKVKQLRHTADGLPKNEDDLIRRIHLDLQKGRILVRAGAPMPTMDIRVFTPAGIVESSGGTFVVAESGQGEWMVFVESDELLIVPRGGSPTMLKEGDTAKLTLSKKAKAQLQTEGVTGKPGLKEFELCNVFFSDLEPFFQDITGLNRDGLSGYLGLSAPILALDSGALVTDASPTIRPAVEGSVPPILPRPAAGDLGGRWDLIRIGNWFENLGPLRGVNYIPRTAVNSVEMWMEDTFDPDTIDEELAWAEKIGYNGIRVQLQYAVWKADPDGFLDRMDQLLKIASSHGLRVVPVLFDDMNVAGTSPKIGKQPAPVPGVYNSRWVPSPAPKVVKDRSQWPELEKYVKGVLESFKRDGRVLYWDLYNTAGNDGLWEETLPLMDQTFNWAREVDPSQPLAVPAWKNFGSAMTARKLERSDLITFQSFENVVSIEAHLLLLQQYQRPIICSDWLVRQVGSDFEKVLPLFSTYRVGWFNSGLVSGKTQMQVQQSKFASKEDPDLWQQGVLHEDGKAYNKKEVELIQGFRYLEAR